MRLSLFALAVGLGPGLVLAQAPPATPPADAAFCLRVARHGMDCRAQHGDPVTGNTIAFGACMTRALGVQDSLRAVALLDRARGSWAGALMECARR